MEKAVTIRISKSNRPETCHKNKTTKANAAVIRRTIIKNGRSTTNTKQKKQIVQCTY
jgi:hypothetical protein